MRNYLKEYREYTIAVLAGLVLVLSLIGIIDADLAEKIIALLVAALATQIGKEKRAARLARGEK